MKATAIFFVVALLITLDSCGDTSITPPSHTTATIDTIQDLQRLDTVFRRGGLLDQREVIFQDDSSYHALEQEARTNLFLATNKSLPFVDFTIRTVIGMGDRGDRLFDSAGNMVQMQFFCIRNDSSRTYTCLSRFVYPDIQPRTTEGFHYPIHLYSIPKLLPGYSVVFVRDTI